MEKPNKPIGIFDSGLGGLTVLSSLAKNLPDESFIYLGDLARLPYGAKSPETIKKYAQQIMDRLIKEDVKAIVIACNSASSVFISESSYHEIPLFNVIEPGVKDALRHTHSKKIAVMATVATTSSKAYTKSFHKSDQNIQVTEIACPLLVPLAEQGWINDELTKLSITRYLEPILESSIDTVVLGCTHYPILFNDISFVLGEKVALVDSRLELEKLLRSQLLASQEGSQRFIKIYVTDMTPQFKGLVNKLLGDVKVDMFEVINL